MSRTTKNLYPPAFDDDDDLPAQFKLGLAEALAATFSESDWKKVSMRYHLQDQIDDHQRFLRALKWNDSDYEGLVLDLIDYLYGTNQGAVIDLFSRDEVQRWLERNKPDVLESWQFEEDPLLAALSHSVEELQDSAKFDLGQYTARIQKALPSDPKLAIGAVKDMLEATMRTILSQRGFRDVEKLDFPPLTTKCLTELGLISTVAPKTAGERHIRKIASAARNMIEAANDLRNEAGTGHGKTVGSEEDVSTADAYLVTSSGFILAAWMLRHSDPC
jgi:hypothetical protein